MMLSKMIDMYDCDYEPTNKEIQILLKLLKPGQKLPLLNDLECPEDYPDQLVYENYLDRLLEGYTIKFVTDRIIYETMPKAYLTMNRRLYSILWSICDVIKHRDLDFHFEWYPKNEVLRSTTINQTLKRDVVMI